MSFKNTRHLDRFRPKRPERLDHFLLILKSYQILKILHKDELSVHISESHNLRKLEVPRSHLQALIV